MVVPWTSVGFVGGAAAHGVGSSCGVLMPFLGVLASGAGMIVTDTIAMRPAIVAIVRVALWVGVDGVKFGTELGYRVVGFAQVVGELAVGICQVGQGGTIGLGGTGEIGKGFGGLMLNDVGAMVAACLGCLLSFEMFVLGKTEE